MIKELTKELEKVCLEMADIFSKGSKRNAEEEARLKELFKIEEHLNEVIKYLEKNSLQK